MEPACVTTVPFGLLVWSTGICASPLVNSLEQVSKDPKTKSILTDTRLRAMSSDAPEAGSGSGSVLSNVFAIGDCAVISNEALPATAQVATQKGLYLAKILNARAGSAQESEEFRFVDRGSMASLGSGRAIVDLPRNKEAGRLAFVFWRSAYTYMRCVSPVRRGKEEVDAWLMDAHALGFCVDTPLMTYSMSWRNRILVPFYWAINSIFGRDVSTRVPSPVSRLPFAPHA